jgi:hypothetical protein
MDALLPWSFLWKDTSPLQCTQILATLKEIITVMTQDEIQADCQATLSAKSASKTASALFSEAPYDSIFRGGVLVAKAWFFPSGLVVFKNDPGLFVILRLLKIGHHKYAALVQLPAYPSLCDRDSKSLGTLISDAGIVIRAIEQTATPLCGRLADDIWELLQTQRSLAEVNAARVVHNRDRARYDDVRSERSMSRADTIVLELANGDASDSPLYKPVQTRRQIEAEARVMAGVASDDELSSESDDELVELTVGCSEKGCIRRFATARGLKTHIARSHTKPKTPVRRNGAASDSESVPLGPGPETPAYKCFETRCSESFSTKKAMKQHHNRDHQTPAQPSPRRHDPLEKKIDDKLSKLVAALSSRPSPAAQSPPSTLGLVEEFGATATKLGYQFISYKDAQADARERSMDLKDAMLAAFGAASSPPAAKRQKQSHQVDT